MRKKELRLIITFHTTSDSIAFEKGCKDSGLSGRMIPVPRELSAGCGLAWQTEPSLRGEMEALAGKLRISPEEMAELMY